MSIQFNDTTNFKGLVQGYERELGLERGYISGNTNRLKEFAAEVNTTWDEYMHIASRASGTWQFDDSNHTDYPIIYFDIVSGQADYSWTTDNQSNLVLDIYQVLILPTATDTIYRPISPIDELEGSDILTENSNATGSPDRYAKLANGIFLDPKPNYNSTKGIQLVINREASYFDSTDTTKKPGCPGTHHEYFFLKPAMKQARRSNLSSFNRLQDAVISFEGDEERGITGSIEKTFAKRERDVRDVLEPEPIIYK